MSEGSQFSCKNTLVRVYKSSGDEWIGNGILIDQDKILTCAHVVNAALDRDEKDYTKLPPTERIIFVDFPQSEGTERLKVLVQTINFDKNLALLRLFSPLPSDIDLAKLEKLKALIGTKVSVLGFPERVKDGFRINGEITGKDSDNYYQIVKCSKQECWTQSEYSGSAVWSGESTVVGIISHVEAGVGYMIPVETVVKTFPGISFTESQPIDVETVSVPRWKKIANKLFLEKPSQKDFFLAIAAFMVAVGAWWFPDIRTLIFPRFTSTPNLTSTPFLSPLASTSTYTVMPTLTQVFFRVWVNSSSPVPIYETSIGNQTKSFANPFSEWYQCGEASGRVQVARKMDCLATDGWIETRFLTLGPAPTKTFTPTPVLSPTPTFTSTITPTPTITLTPTITPTLDGKRGIDESCFYADSWFPQFRDANLVTVDEEGKCRDFSDWGIAAKGGNILLLREDKTINYEITRGFYTPIANNAIISFNLEIKDMTASKEYDSILAFGIGSSQEEVIYRDKLKAGQFLVYGKKGSGKVYRRTGTSIFPSDEKSTYFSAPIEQKVVITLGKNDFNQPEIEITVDGQQLLTTPIVQSNSNHFWIVYQIGAENGALDAQISDFQIIEK